MQVSLPAWKGRRCLASTAACTAASAASESSIGRKPPTDRFRRNLESRKEDGSEPSVMAASVPLGLPLGACASLPRRACMHPRLLARTRRPSSITGQQQRAGGGWLEQAPQTAASRQRATPPASQEPEPPGAEAPLPPSEGPCLQVCMEDLFSKFLLAAGPSDGEGYGLTAQQADKLLHGLWRAIPAGATNAQELPPFFLGGITLAPDSPAAPAASGEPLRHVIVDGQERIFALLLLLAAAREHLATDLHLLGALSGSSILPRDLMQQAGALLSPEEGWPLVRLASEEDTCFLQSYLHDPARKPGIAELSVAARSRLWACLKLFRWRLEDSDILRLTLLVHFILTRVIASITILPGVLDTSQPTETEPEVPCLQREEDEPEAMQQHTPWPKFWTELEALVQRNPEPEPQPEPQPVQAQERPAAAPQPLGGHLCLDHLPGGSEVLAASADIHITVEGCMLPLHSAVLAAGCHTLCQVLCSAGAGKAAGSSASGQDAVQQAFQGQPLVVVQLFLKLLYTGGTASESVAESTSFQRVVPLAHALDAPFVLQACEARLLQLLPCEKYRWAEWLVLADCCGLRQLKPVAAEQALADLLSLPDSAERGAMLRRMRGLSAATYQELFEAIVEGLAQAGPGKEKSVQWQLAMQRVLGTGGADLST